MKDMPYLVNSIAELPAGLQVAAISALPPDAPVQTILYIPRHTQTKQKRRRFAPQQALLFTSTGVLQIQDAYIPGEPPTAIYLRSADLLTVRHSLILLYGCLELDGSANGAPARIVVEYNTSRAFLLLPALQPVLALAYGPAPEDRVLSASSTTERLAHLETQSFKFHNGLRLYALLPGERLLGYVWQPRITQRIAGIFPRAIGPATLLALTDRAVILIQEERAKGAAYGWIISFYPRCRIVDTVTRPQSQWYAVKVQLTGVETPVFIMEKAQADAWEALWRIQGNR